MKKMQVAIMVAAVVMIFNVTPAPADPINLALTGTATQESVWAAGQTADKAIDGILLNDNTNLAHTRDVANEPTFWQVDLGNTYYISDIDLYNRLNLSSGDNFGWRIYGAVVSIISVDATVAWSDTLPDKASLYSSTVPNTLGAEFHWDFASPVQGKIVRVELQRTSDDLYIQLREVQVWGSSTPPGPGPVPIPAAAWLLGSGLIGLVAVRRRMRK